MTNDKCAAVIFDLDGTLVDSIGGLQEAVNQVLVGHGYPPLDRKETEARIGHGVTELIRQALPAGARDEKNVKACTQEMRNVYETCWRNGTHPYPGIPELLQQLRDHRIPFAIHTNKMQNITDLIVKELFASYAFFPIIGSDGPYPLKPDPAGALAVADALQVLPGECLFVGDSEADMLTARNAKMTAVGVLWGFRNAQSLLANGANHLVATPADIMSLVKT